MRRIDGSGWCHGLAALVGSVLLGAASASGAIFQVDTTADTLDASAGDGSCADASGACSLRAAVEEANALAGADEVSIPAGDYVVMHDTLYVFGDLTLRGAGAQATVIRGGAFFNDGDDLVVERLAITGSPFGGIVQLGGGIGASLALSETIVSDNGQERLCSMSWCAGVLTFGSRVTVTRSTIAGNRGGGLLGADALTVTESSIMDNFGPAISSPQTLVLKNSAITGNGGNYGVIVAATGRIENSTISGNVSSNYWFCEAPGQLPCGCERGDPVVSGEFEIQYSTIADNSADTSGCAAMPYPVVPGPVRLRGTVLSNPGFANCSGPQESSGHNLDSDGTCSLAEATDLSGIDPLLGPLQNNGGPTPTHALLPESPALDAVPHMDCTFDDDGDPATPEEPLRSDQRGASRPQGAGCDIGAFEATSCSDGLDNDGDGLVDYPADPGCRFGTSTVERTQCQDGLNNDGQTGIDFDGGGSVNGGVPLDVRDPQCTYAWQNRERSGCGLGFELALVVPALGWLRRRGRAARVS